MITSSTKINYYSRHINNNKSLGSYKTMESDSTKSLQLGVLDFGMITPGKTAQEVIQETLASASLADSLGYSRYWLTEHHEPCFAWASAETMLALIAQSTGRIRVGTAGILLHLYSPLKIAQVFRLLAVLYPQRIDLGIARAVAADRETIQALAPGFEIEAATKDDLYGQKVSQLIDYLTDNFRIDGDTAFDAVPKIKEIPPMWLLGTGERSMHQAASLGTAFSYSLLHACSKQDPNVVREYHRQFQPSAVMRSPKCNLALSVVCAETEAKARQQQALVEKVDETSRVNVVGTPEQCKEQLLELQRQYQVSEMIIISPWHIFEQRKLSYQMLSEVLNLSALHQDRVI